MRFISIRYIFLIILFSFTYRIYTRESNPPFLKYVHHPWVDSVFNSLSQEERIAQLIWVYAFSNREIGHEVYLSNVIEKTGVGGVVFSGGNAVKQTEMLNYFRKISKVPLIIAADGELGPGIRLDGIVKFPYRMTLGAIRNDSLIYQTVKAVAIQYKRAGVHVNLAPVAEGNNNPQNPLINYESFGEDPKNVSRKTLIYLNGLLDNGIISVA